MSKRIIYLIVLIVIAIIIKQYHSKTDQIYNEMEIATKYGLEKPTEAGNVKIEMEIKDISFDNGLCYIKYKFIDENKNSFYVDDVFLEVKAENETKNFDTTTTYDNKKSEGTISILMNSKEEHIRLNISKVKYKLNKTMYRLNIGLDMMIPIKELEKSNTI